MYWTNIWNELHSGNLSSGKIEYRINQTRRCFKLRKRQKTPVKKNKNISLFLLKKKKKKIFSFLSRKKNKNQNESLVCGREAKRGKKDCWTTITKQLSHCKYQKERKKKKRKLRDWLDWNITSLAKYRRHLCKKLLLQLQTEQSRHVHLHDFT